MAVLAESQDGSVSCGNMATVGSHTLHSYTARLNMKMSRLSGLGHTSDQVDFEIDTVAENMVGLILIAGRRVGN